MFVLGVIIIQFNLFLRWLIIFSCIFSARAQETGPQEEHVVAGIDPVMEVRLGKLYRDKALKNYHVSKNQAYTDIVNRVGNRIANAIGERPDLIDDWEFTVVQSDDVNAVAFGGGKIVVFEGILKLMTLNGGIDEDMLAAVLGHEMTHVVRRHVLIGLSDQGSLAWILEHINAIESNTASGGLTPEELDKLGTLARARFSRVQEFEADRFGALFAVRAGYSGFNGALRWMQLVDQKLGDYSTETYLPFEGKQGEYLAADHPTWKERIAALLAYRENILNLAGEFNWGFYLLRSYNFEKAAECFNDVTKIFPESFEAWNNLGTAYLWMYLAPDEPDRRPLGFCPAANFPKFALFTSTLDARFLLFFCYLLNRSDIFGFVNSGIVDRPFPFLILIIDLDEAPIPLNLFVIVVPEALHWSNNNGVNANDGRDEADVLLLKIFRSTRKADLFYQSGAARSARFALNPTRRIR